jgi:dihydrofolate synthase/folylpolyglutamate synthase
MKYHDALRYLYSLVDYEKRRIERYSPKEFKLARVETFLEKLGNPHKQLATVHIAGTKGKGSVSAMLASCAQAAGLRVGLYTSPHLHTYRERIQINAAPGAPLAPITRSALTSLVDDDARPIVPSVPGITTFEVTTALAFLYFARENVDLAVMEVGLGGRLDATNVITPYVSLITSLSLDHTYLLGDTIADIAREKGGIIKPGVPVVSAPQPPEAVHVLETLARERETTLTLVGRDWTWEPLERTLDGQRIRVSHCRDVKSYVSTVQQGFEGEYYLNLLGDFQQENATLAVAASAALNAQGHTWATPKTIRYALAHAQWPGRLEVLHRDPPLVVDCAHNPYSAQKLVESLRTWFPDTRWVLIYGASTDKDIDGMLRALLSFSAHVIVTRSYHPRAATPYALADKCADLGPGAEIAIDPEHALEQACHHLEPDMGILATGSIFLVADVREVWGKPDGCRKMLRAQAAFDLPQGDWVDEPWEAT